MSSCCALVSGRFSCTNSNARILSSYATYVSQCSISLLQCCKMTGIGLLATQDALTAVHPPKPSIGSKIGALALESAYGCIYNDTVVACQHPINTRPRLILLLALAGSGVHWWQTSRGSDWRKHLRLELPFLILWVAGSRAGAAGEWRLEDGLGLARALPEKGVSVQIVLLGRGCGAQLDQVVLEIAKVGHDLGYAHGAGIVDLNMSVDGFHGLGSGEGRLTAVRHGGY